MLVALIRRAPSAAILAFQLAAVIAYPCSDGSTPGRAALGIVQVMVVLSAVRAVRLSPAQTTVALTLGLPAMVMALWESASPDTHRIVGMTGRRHRS